MEKTAIVADTNSGLTPQQADSLGIYLLPMPFLIDGEQYLEGQNCPAEVFFEKLRAGADVSTSQPSPGSIAILWDRLLRKYDRILHFPMSSTLSGSCQTARAMALEYPGRVFVVDNRRVSVTLYQSILQAKRLLEGGMPAADVWKTIEEESAEQSIYLAVNTLAYLKKSGRVTPAAAAMASVLNLKPVLQIQGGKLDAYKKVRGMAAARQTMLAAMKEDLANRFAGEDMALFAVYSGKMEDGAAWQKIVQGEFPDREVEFAALPLSICCHVGDGVQAIACAKK
ncbi:MAG: DegV family protein [Oscillibacter sp.]|jgi:DegV family protein with EDD domain|nr:DegV family protein [Oscillibacter sp.]